MQGGGHPQRMYRRHAIGGPMTRKALPRLLAAAGTVAALAVALTSLVGAGSARGSAAQANYAPTNTSPPTISGTPQVGQTLTASPGSWNSDSTPTFTYQWERCDANGNGCAAVAGSTSQTYSVQSTDVGGTIRVSVTATSPSGASSAVSAQTAAVTQAGPQGAVKLQNGKTSIPASSVSLPNRLVIDGIRSTPRVIHSRGPVIVQFHVSDTRGFVVRDALVYVLGLPYGWTRASGAVSGAPARWGP